MVEVLLHANRCRQVPAQHARLLLRMHTVLVCPQDQRAGKGRHEIAPVAVCWPAHQGIQVPAQHTLLFQMA